MAKQREVTLTPCSDGWSGDWQVTRFCCTSGQCVDCRQERPGAHVNPSRKRIVHMDKLSERAAKMVAQNWANYGAEVERMPEAPR